VHLADKSVRSGEVRRSFFKDPVSGRRRARLRPESEWQVAEYPERRIITDALWERAQARFATSGRPARAFATHSRAAGRDLQVVFDKLRPLAHLGLVNAGWRLGEKMTGGF
jgi:hypothetical protein